MRSTTTEKRVKRDLTDLTPKAVREEEATEEAAETEEAATEAASEATEAASEEKEAATEEKEEAATEVAEEAIPEKMSMKTDS